MGFRSLGTKGRGIEEEAGPDRGKGDGKVERQTLDTGPWGLPECR